MVADAARRDQGRGHQSLTDWAVFGTADRWPSQQNLAYVPPGALSATDLISQMARYEVLAQLVSAVCVSQRIWHPMWVRQMRGRVAARTQSVQRCLSSA